MTETRTGLDVGQAAEQDGKLVLGSVEDPARQPLPAESANPVKVARSYAESVLVEVARIDADHVDDVVLAVSELVTNAICHAVGEGRLSVRLVVRPRWTHLYVTDPDSTVPQTTQPGDDDLSLSGRGVPIVGQLGLLWFVPSEHGKTAHAVITRTGEKLTDEEREALIRLQIV
ncbi:hypothetical protein GCM10023191_005700 [Actinoallomurus oryzae]|uniref:Histidine kinase/HSP90-like ATPase domain-containing protein n=1 Tax=Actinoallomurus oryzae TaxID=502180 RepID=A0ABP8PB67_9ACTN